MKKFETLTDDDGNNWTIMDMVKERNRKKVLLAKHEEARNGIFLAEKLTEMTQKSLRKKGMIK